MKKSCISLREISIPWLISVWASLFCIRRKEVSSYCFWILWLTKVLKFILDSLLSLITSSNLDSSFKIFFSNTPSFQNQSSSVLNFLISFSVSALKTYKFASKFRNFFEKSSNLLINPPLLLTYSIKSICFKSMLSSEILISSQMNFSIFLFPVFTAS